MLIATSLRRGPFMEPCPSGPLIPVACCCFRAGSPSSPSSGATVTAIGGSCANVASQTCRRCTYHSVVLRCGLLCSSRRDLSEYRHSPVNCLLRLRHLALDSSRRGSETSHPPPLFLRMPSTTRPDGPLRRCGGVSTPFSITRTCPKLSKPTQ